MNMGIFTEEMDRWNVVKLITGFLVFYCLTFSFLSLSVLLGGPSEPGALAGNYEIAETPGKKLIWYGSGAAFWAYMFYIADHKRKKVIQEKYFPRSRKGS